MKKLLLFIVALVTAVFLFTGCARLEKNILNLSFKRGLQFNLNEENNSYSVTFIGKKTGAEVIIPETYNGLPVTMIAPFAFMDCEDLVSISIPSSITSIKKSAFKNCPNLKNVYISDIKAWCEISYDYGILGLATSSPMLHASNIFLNGEPLTDLVIPNDVTLISENAFRGCEGIKSLTIGENVKRIEQSAFRDCVNIEKIYYNATSMDWVEEILSLDINEYSHVFSSVGTNTDGIEVVIGKNVKTLPKYLFSSYYPSKITSVEFEEGSVCESIGYKAFGNCQEIESVYLYDISAWCNISFGSDGGYYPYYSFETNPLYHADILYLCGEPLTDLVIPDDINEIKPIAFCGCDFLTGISIPDSVTYINEYAFLYCSGIIEKENGIYYVDKWAIDYDSSATDISFREDTIGIAEDAFYGCAGLSETELPCTIKYIGDSAFKNCSNLTSISLPEGIVSLCDSTFENCTSLTELTIPDSVTSIGDRAFYGCASLTDIIVPNNVSSIGEYAFADCTSLTTVVISDSVSFIGEGAFDNCTSLSIYCKSQARPSDWSAFWNPNGCPVVWGYED